MRDAEEYSDEKGPRGLSLRDLYNIIQADKKGKEELRKVMEEIWARGIGVEDAGTNRASS